MILICFCFLLLVLWWYMNMRKRRKICDSLYHRRWFRVLLLVLGFDMLSLGFSFALGLDFLSFASHFPVPLRVGFGMLYLLGALFLVHYALGYRELTQKHSLVCRHCLEKDLS